MRLVRVRVRVRVRDRVRARVRVRVRVRVRTSGSCASSSAKRPHMSSARNSGVPMTKGSGISGYESSPPAAPADVV
tara:strand:+ start:361 stop:588 length:228 start_codon:yes stop_codon:yes gene_type:complete